MSDEILLKNQLAELLKKDNIDYGQMLSLASKISAHDQENVRFSIDAKLVERLGEQLV